VFEFKPSEKLLELSDGLRNFEVRLEHPANQRNELFRPERHPREIIDLFTARTKEDKHLQGRSIIHLARLLGNDRNSLVKVPGHPPDVQKKIRP